MIPFKTVCLALPERVDRSREHFKAMGVDASFFIGINAQKVGLETKNPYEVDGGKGCGFNMGPKHVGIYIGHRMLWSALLLFPDERFLILEGDAQFGADWSARTQKALVDVPPDWDALFIGSCCAENRPKTYVRGEIWEVKWPMCGHAYMVTRAGLQKLITLTDAQPCYAPMDIHLTFHCFPKMRIYTMLPRAVAQFDTGIEP